MGGTPSCDSASECVIRACQFSNHGPGDINRATNPRAKDDSDAAYRDQVTTELKSFFLNNKEASANSVTTLRATLTGNDTPTMDINAGCIGFKDAIKTTEKFKSSQSRGSLLACTIIGIIIAIMIVFAWHLLCHRTYKQSNDDVPQTTRTIRLESPPQE